MYVYVLIMKVLYMRRIDKGYNHLTIINGHKHRQPIKDKARKFLKAKEIFIKGKI